MLASPALILAVLAAEPTEPAEAHASVVDGWVLADRHFSANLGVGVVANRLGFAAQVQLHIIGPLSVVGGASTALVNETATANVNAVIGAGLRVAIPLSDRVRAFMQGSVAMTAWHRPDGPPTLPNLEPFQWAGEAGGGFEFLAFAPQEGRTFDFSLFTEVRWLISRAPLPVLSNLTDGYWHGATLVLGVHVPMF